MGTIKVEFEHFPEYTSKEGEVMPTWYCYLPQFAGIGESGKTKDEAFTECMKSLIVKIMHDNKIQSSENTVWRWELTVPQAIPNPQQN